MGVYKGCIKVYRGLWRVQTFGGYTGGVWRYTGAICGRGNNAVYRKHIGVGRYRGCMENPGSVMGGGNLGQGN